MHTQHAGTTSRHPRGRTRPTALTPGPRTRTHSGQFPNHTCTHAAPGTLRTPPHTHTGQSWPHRPPAGSDHPSVHFQEPHVPLQGGHRGTQTTLGRAGPSTAPTQSTPHPRHTSHVHSTQCTLKTPTHFETLPQSSPVGPSLNCKAPPRLPDRGGDPSTHQSLRTQAWCSRQVERERVGARARRCSGLAAPPSSRPLPPSLPLWLRGQLDFIKGFGVGTGGGVGPRWATHIPPRLPPRQAPPGRSGKARWGTSSLTTGPQGRLRHTDRQTDRQTGLSHSAPKTASWGPTLFPKRSSTGGLGVP